MDNNNNNNRANRSSFSRFPDTGPLNIQNYQEFLKTSKVQFYEYLGRPLVHKETLNDFDKLKALASGAYGNVYLVKKTETDIYFAMKTLKKKTIIEKRQVDHTRNEKMILRAINSPNTVYMMYFFKDNSYLYIVMPFVSGGELFYHLQRLGKFKEDQAKFFVCQMVLAIEYLHFLNLVYRDLKPENILIDETGYLKLTDFGFCKTLTTGRTYTMCGTSEYLAPEVISNKGYGKYVDWWCIGVLMYELVAGNAPFHSSDTMRIYEKIIANSYKIPPSFSHELKDLIKNMLQSDLTRRFGNLKKGVDDIKDHKWFSEINWLAVFNRTVTSPYIPDNGKTEEANNFEKCEFEQMEIAKEDEYSKEFADF